MDSCWLGIERAGAQLKNASATETRQNSSVIKLESKSLCRLCLESCSSQPTFFEVSILPRLQLPSKFQGSCLAGALAGRLRVAPASLAQRTLQWLLRTLRWGCLSHRVLHTLRRNLMLCLGQEKFRKDPSHRSLQDPPSLQGRASIRTETTCMYS